MRGPSRRATAIVVWLCGALVACHDAPEKPEPAGESAAPVAPGAPSGHPVLAEARRQLEQGELSPELRAQIVASDDPALARARRWLALTPSEASATADGAATQASPDDDPSASPGRFRVPIVVPENSSSGAPGEVAPVPAVPVRSASVRSAPAVRPAAPSTRPTSPTPEASTTTVEDLVLSSKGETIEILVRANRGVVVGVVSQPESGLLRLILESSRAGRRLLARRPSLGGVRVRDVQAGGRGVVVTLVVPPGYRVLATRRHPSGTLLVVGAERP